MQDEVAMTELQTAERHRDPTLDVSGEEYQRPILNDQLQVRIQELQDKIQVRL